MLVEGMSELSIAYCFKTTSLFTRLLETRLLVELYPEKASSIRNDYREVQAMDEDANYVFLVFHFDNTNELNEDIVSG